IGLSDYAPVGPVTKAPDGFYTPVMSLNTILGTIRLDYIIGEEIPKYAYKSTSGNVSNPPSMTWWKTLADRDYNNAMQARANLINVLKAACTPAGSSQARDLQGQQVTPYQSAEAAYKQNQVRQTGSQYVANSLQISLGCINGLGSETTVQIPQPSSLAQVNGKPTQNGKYLAYINYKLNNGKDFVFCAAGSTIRLVDPQKWTPTISSLPYDFPTVVRAQALHKFWENGSKKGSQHVIRQVACATPACIPDPRPAPGILAIDMPDGNKAPSIDIPWDLISQTQLNFGGTNAKFRQALNGDYIGPGSPGSLSTTDYPNWWPQQPAFGLAGGFYDFVREGGPKVNISSVQGMLNGVGIPNGFFTPNKVYKYTFDQAGNVVMAEKPHALGQEPYIVLSDKQLYMQGDDALDDIKTAQRQTGVDPNTGLPIYTNTNLPTNWQIYMKDEVRQWGDTFGGQHAGQPVPLTGTPLASSFSEKWIACLPNPLPDTAIAMNGSSGTVKLGDVGTGHVGAFPALMWDRIPAAMNPLLGKFENHNSAGALTITTSAPVQPLDDWVTFGGGSVQILYQYSASSPSPTGIPTIYTTNGCAVHMRIRFEDVTDKWDPNGTPGHKLKKP
ncbi:MAG TPA: hypothetical protein V6D17_17820, partial [Candidatus Obscuribacterales bacterium]